MLSSLEAVAQRSSAIKVFLEISQNSLENTSARDERKIQIQWLNISWTNVCLSENIAYVLNVWPLKRYLTSYNSIYLQKKKFIEEAAMFSEHKVTNRMS